MRDGHSVVFTNYFSHFNHLKGHTQNEKQLAHGIISLKL